MIDVVPGLIRIHGVKEGKLLLLMESRDNDGRKIAKKG